MAEEGITEEPDALPIADVQAAGEKFAAEADPKRTVEMHIPREGMRTLAVHVQVPLIAHHSTTRRRAAEPRAADRILAAAVQHTAEATLTSKLVRQHQAAEQTSSAACILARKFDSGSPWATGIEFQCMIRNESSLNPRR
jgi:hypothetical protein